MLHAMKRLVLAAIAACASVSMAQAQDEPIPSRIQQPREDERVVLKADCLEIDQKEQLILERRALGGDLQAQYYVAACAWPLEPKDAGGQRMKLAFETFDLPEISRQEKLPPSQQSPAYRVFKKRISYAYQWASLAFCDRQFNDFGEIVDELEKLEHVYKRKRPNPDFQRVEARQRELESVHLNFIRRSANDYLYLLGPGKNTQAAKSLVRQMNGLGATGLATLGLMRDCPSYPGVEARYARAAIWDSATDAFERSFSFEEAGLLEDADSIDASDKDFLERQRDRWKSVTPEDERFVDAFRLSYGLGGISRARPGTPQDAALGRMGEVPVQYLQLALGAFREVPRDYPQGLIVPRFSVDNIYGEQTSKLAKQAQASYCVVRDVAIHEGALTNVVDPKAGKPKPGDREKDCRKGTKTKPSTEEKRKADVAAGRSKDYPTGWLSAKQSRALICRAATDRGDAFSYMHLAQMFANGEGYPQDLDRALFAAKEAQRLFALGALARRSNLKDNNTIKLIERYSKRAKKLEDEIYAVVGQEMQKANTAVPLDEATIRARIDNRIEVARYSEPNNLCADQEWGYWQNQAAAVSFAPARAAPKSAADGSSGTTQLLTRDLGGEALTDGVGVGGDPVVINGDDASGLKQDDQ